VTTGNGIEQSLTARRQATFSGRSLQQSAGKLDV
jgi:hypothetical protein